MKKQDFLVLFIIVLVIIFLLKISWLKWFDFLIDFGRELYIPWQLTKGKVLYKDIAFHNGPISNYFNSIIFKLFGIGLINIVWVNIILLFLFTVTFYIALRKYFDIYTAFLIEVFVVVLHFIPFFTVIGNYNFITPYSHELLHGFYLSFILFILVSYEKKYEMSFYIKAGIILGIIFLTKIEVFIANFISFVIFNILLTKIQRMKVLITLRNFIVFSFIFFIVIMISALFFKYNGLSFVDYFNAITRAYKVAGDMNKNIFYLERLGIDKLWQNISFSFSSFLMYTVLLIILLSLSYVLNLLRKSIYISFAFVCFGLLIFYIFYLFVDYIMDFFIRMGSMYNLLSICGLLGGIYLYKHNKNCKSNLIFLYLCFLAILFLTRMFFKPTIYHYGFITALPASILFIVLSIKVIDFFGERFNMKFLLRGLYLITITVFLFTIIMYITIPAYSSKSIFVNRGKDSFYIFNQNYVFGEQDRVLLEALNYIDKNLKKDETFISFPEGIMLNYLTRRDNPSPYYYFVPTDFILWGEENMLLAIRKNLPDYVLLCNRKTDEFGYINGIGIDYGRILMGYISKRYVPIQQFGDSLDFHIVLAKKLF